LRVMTRKKTLHPHFIEKIQPKAIFGIHALWGCPKSYYFGQPSYVFHNSHTGY
jgi:hypothetical protein